MQFRFLQHYTRTRGPQVPRDDPTVRPPSDDRGQQRDSLDFEPGRVHSELPGRLGLRGGRLRHCQPHQPPVPGFGLDALAQESNRRRRPAPPDRPWRHQQEEPPADAHGDGDRQARQHTGNRTHPRPGYPARAARKPEPRCRDYDHGR